MRRDQLSFDTDKGSASTNTQFYLTLYTDDQTVLVNAGIIPGTGGRAQLNPAVQATFQDNPARPFCSIESLHPKTLCNNNKRKIGRGINWLRENIEIPKMVTTENRAREELRKKERRRRRRRRASTLHLDQNDVQTSAACFRMFLAALSHLLARRQQALLVSNQGSPRIRID